MSVDGEPEIRILESEDDLRAALALFRTAMVGLPAGPPIPDGRIGDHLEPGRTHGAFVDGTLVGTVDATSGTLVLPGGRRVPHAGVTHVGVLPTHTRRGIVTALMRRQLRDARDRGDVVASLRASEATIYGRFGYGIASSTVRIEVDVRRAALRRTVPTGGPVRLGSFPDTWELLERTYSRNLPDRPGGIERTPLWWAPQRLRQAASTTPSYVAVHGEQGAEDGFVRYRPVGTDEWFTSRERTVVVDDFFAPTAEAHAALVRFLLGLDLVDRIVFATMPVDDPLPWLLTDHRAARIGAMSDETWLRILDVPATLAARRYGGAGAVRIGVTDPLFDDNTGVYVIEPSGVERVGGPADLELDVADLGSLLLGGVDVRTLVAAGRVRVNDPAAVATAHALFAWPQAPFAGTMF